VSPPSTYPVAVIHGRFQPLHHGHLEYLLAGADRAQTLVVGITNPDPWQVVEEATDPTRGLPEANPCTFYERYLMVEGSLTAAGVAHHRLRIVPFPHSFPERLSFYAPCNATYLLTIYDTWGMAKLDRFRELGLATEVMWRRDEKPISGARVRAAIAAGEAWEQLVPPAVTRVVKEWGIDARIRG
jgi:nicotinamide-nucleotide adenylyltransferase/phosphinothricin biosynthesis protein PhpF